MNYFQQLWSNVNGEFDLHILWFFITMIAQIAIISYFVIWAWKRIVGSQAERLVKGVLVLAGIWGLASLLQFDLITTILQMIFPVAVLALVIIFQPELRRGLGHLGKVNTLKFDFSLTSVEQTQLERDLDQIISAVRELSRSKTGALIVVEPMYGERDYVSPGTTINADISTTLLLTIFFDKSPLHDGAVVIRKNKVVAAGVILPMTDDPELSYRYGTRHRAAIGLSETYDGLCIVVSEETGAISAASRGMLARYKDPEDLRNPIRYLYTQGGDAKSTEHVNTFLNLFNKNSTGQSETDTVGSDKSVDQDQDAASVAEPDSEDSSESKSKEESDRKDGTDPDTTDLKNAPQY